MQVKSAVEPSFYIMFDHQLFEAIQCFSSKKCPPAHPLRVLRARLEKVWRFAGLHLKNQEDPSWASTSISHPTNMSSVQRPEEMYSSTHSTQHYITLHIGSIQSLLIFMFFQAYAAQNELLKVFNVYTVVVFLLLYTTCQQFLNNKIFKFFKEISLLTKPAFFSIQNTAKVVIL